MAALALLLGLLAGPGIWLDVPFIHQPEKGCGSAVAWMVLQYWSAVQPAEQGSDPKPSFEEIHRQLYSPKKGGVSTTDLERFFSDRNFQTYSIRGTWADLEHHLAKGRPVIVCLKQRAFAAPLHFVTVTGMDREQDVLLVNDPAGRKLQKVDRADFEAQWKLADNWTLLVVPR